jgi:hypothetical protein
MGRGADGIVGVGLAEDIERPEEDDWFEVVARGSGLAASGGLAIGCSGQGPTPSGGTPPGGRSPPGGGVTMTSGG